MSASATEKAREAGELHPSPAVGKNGYAPLPNVPDGYGEGVVPPVGLPPPVYQSNPNFQQAYQAPPQPSFMVRQTEPQPPDYLPLALVVTVCCCLPFGIIGVVKAMEVRNRYTIGDMMGAREASRAAKRWSLAGLISGILIQVLLYGFLVVYYVAILPQLLNQAGLQDGR
ncbi:proline-rich transmembrane protein 1-like [Diadema antillarum]|uniref:proline-rich transmembrane protein 1-like n=1 Tax=Diadema antillarum TaxID=105358 RepID=UPI003A878F01